MTRDDPPLDCLVVGAGPAGLTAALYLARFGRRFAVVDGGDSRAAWIPVSHNFPLSPEGLGGEELLARLHDHVGRYGVRPLRGHVASLLAVPGGFEAALDEADGGRRLIRAKRALLATGSVDVEPTLPDLPDAVRRGLVRYCPICDGFEARGERVAVLGHGARGLGEASFLARTYSRDVTLLTLGEPMVLDEEARGTLRRHGIKVVTEPIEALAIEGARIAAVRAGGIEHRFDTLYSALGLRVRNGLALALGAEQDEGGALVVDSHNRTGVPGLYAAGDLVRGLNQVVVAMGHAAIAATAIHNRCEMPTEDEPVGAAG